MPVPDPGPPIPLKKKAVSVLKIAYYMILRVYSVMVCVFLGGLGCFNGPHDGYANS